MRNYYLRFVRSLVAGIVLILVSFQLSAQGSELSRITIFLYAPGLSQTDSVYIAGNHSKLGNWQPDQVPMQYVMENLWRFVDTFPSQATLQYKFTLGSWASEALDSLDIPFQNHQLVINKDSGAYHEVMYWKKDALLGQITGKVKYHRNIAGNGLKERDILVWLPPSYKNDPNMTYPVLYMHDGQNVVDPATSYSGVDWQVDETADQLIRDGSIEPFIMVGIYNTSDRTQEYTPGHRGTAYMDFVALKVKPLVDSLYRTKPQREFTFTGGSSAGGLIAFMLLWEYSELFSGSICMSPAFKVSDETIAIDYISYTSKYQGVKKDIKLYVYNGGQGIELILQPGVDEMINTLNEMGLENGKDLIYMLDKEAVHNESAWAKQVAPALLFILGK